MRSSSSCPHPFRPSIVGAWRVCDEPMPPTVRRPWPRSRMRSHGIRWCGGSSRTTRPIPPAPRRSSGSCSTSGSPWTGSGSPTAEKPWRSGRRPVRHRSSGRTAAGTPSWPTSRPRRWRAATSGTRRWRRTIRKRRTGTSASSRPPARIRARVSGPAVAQPGIDAAVTAGIPAFLETGVERNVVLYERMGFVITGVIDDPALPRGWCMRRD